MYTRSMADEKSVRELRSELADVLNAAVAGEITYITSRGRRIAAVVPLAVATQADPDEPAKPPRRKRPSPE
jgi:prevent-host-death family protein